MELLSGERGRSWLRGLSVGYFILLALWLGFLEWWGGKGWVLSVALFVPPQLWLCPLMLLTPLCLGFHRKLCWLHLGAVGLVFFGYMNWHFGFRESDRTPDLTLLSNNIAQRSLKDLLAFAQEQKPDVLAFQDVGRFLRDARGLFPNYFVDVNQEFALISRYRILNAKPVPDLTFKGKSIAFRYELICNQRRIAIYNIHMPTPRPFLLNMRGDDVGKTIRPKSGIFSRDLWEEYADYWYRRLELTQMLLEYLQAEQKPFLLVGDFNMPDHGALYHEFTARFVDVFGAYGQGYGLSFPGNMDTAFSFDRPWMRIDYQFADSHHWRPVSCRIEPCKPAKHLALVGRYQFGK